MRHFTTGGFLFTGGTMTMLIAENILSPSLSQELIALSGLLAAASGILMALWGYLTISLFKILIYLLERPSDS